MYRAITTKVVILGIEYRYRSLSSIEVSSIDVIAGIVLTLLDSVVTLSEILCFRLISHPIVMATQPKQQFCAFTETLSAHCRQ